MGANQNIYIPEKAGSNNMLPGDLNGSPDDFLPCFVFIDAGFLSKLSKYFGAGRYLKYDLVKLTKQDFENCQLKLK